MAFTGNWTCNSFKTGLMNGAFNLTSGVFYISLYTNDATLNAQTTDYTTVGEVTDPGYAPQQLVISQVPTFGGSGNIAYMSFENVSWDIPLTARGALIYAQQANGAICVLDFGADKTSASTFTVQFPAVTNSSAIIRLA